MKNITKTFPGVKALDNVNLNIKRGEIHGLCGENGAGKSTLMKVLSGVYPYKSYTGDIVIDGKVQKYKSVADSEKAGVAIIYQELALVKDITVAENIFLGKLVNNHGIVNWNAVYSQARILLEEIGVDADLDAKIRNLGVGQQQLVEIAKALVLNATILILDEPTAALTEVEVDLLMNILKGLRAKGVTCILITHKLNEIFEICDNVTVLRDGSTIKTMSSKETDEEELIKYMVGRELTNRYPEATRIAKKTMLKVENINFVNLFDQRLVKDVSFEAKSGEILGIAGLMGAGRTELISSIFGFASGNVTGQIFIDGKETKITHPMDAISSKMAMLSEDRARFGLIKGQSICNNITLASLDQVSKRGVLNKQKEFSIAKNLKEDLGVKANSVAIDVATLSGGNQQKVLLARCLMTKPKVLFLDEPTRGIDVGAKYEIYMLMNKLASQGTAIIMVSSELPEIMGMSDRVIVMCEGSLAGELDKTQLSQENIMTLASGGTL
jgi:D-xylose transport system ATP-binding protein